MAGLIKQKMTTNHLYLKLFNQNEISFSDSIFPNLNKFLSMNADILKSVDLEFPEVKKIVFGLIAKRSSPLF